MKIGNPANYYVRVWARSWDEEPEQAALYEGIYSFDLNEVVSVSFVPAVTTPRPWSLDDLPGDISEFTTSEQVRVYELLGTEYSVTPDETRAGTEEQFDWPYDWDAPLPPPHPTVFYVTPEEFARLSADLEALSDIAGKLHSFVRREEVVDHEVVRFIERRILDSPLLAPASARAIGR
ncbi:hypothetical protein MRQ36_21665 [Micromonospora sp. R77]|uniref:hypothetical protein n=1 Tax=Micromonospora sp. R77 TaxID=2925836 RepID=UPI001F61FE70|nr:hypothetical protein [Micromonospora sp. R77]MCI4065027.1 hypothetical protein [Micromonospora sp. R77]